MRLGLHRSRVLLISDIGQIKELTKCTRYNEEFALFKGGEQLIERLPGVTVLSLFGAQTNLLYPVEQRFACIVANNFAQYVAQQPHVGAQRGSIDHLDHGFSSDCERNRLSVPGRKPRRLQTIFNARQMGQNALAAAQCHARR